jgi:phage terminase large subunit-like protein
MASDADDYLALLIQLRRAVRRCGGDWERAVNLLPPPVQRRLREEFYWQVHGAQKEPDGNWRVWLLMAGRGFGKTRVGAEWISARAREMPNARIALVGGSRDEVAKVMIEGASGLIAVARTGESLDWVPTHGVVRFSSGAEAFVYSASAAEKLRGPEHHFAWCDELAKWEQADATWDNLQMGMRLGERPRLVVTTTPRAVEIVRRVKALKGTRTSRGRTVENEHLPHAFLDWAEQTYGGTRLGRQELDGVLFEDVAGALFPRELIEASRQSGTLPREGLKRVVVGVDPPGSVEGGCGIVVCGLGADEVIYVLADCSVAGVRPEGWARAVVRAAEVWEADRIVAEQNQGGDMVESVLKNVEARLPVKLVSASKGKGGSGGAGGGFVRGRQGPVCRAVFRSWKTSLQGWCSAAAMRGRGDRRTGRTRWYGQRAL